MSTFSGGGRYQPVRALGAGGMGRVCLARDSVLLREVALKVLDEHHAGIEEFVERFRREAKAAASLSHPHIVAVYDYGENERGVPYIAMEYVSGGMLKDRIRERGKLPPRVAASVTLQIATALEVAHQRGIVHRDLKPENVLVSADGNVKVTDFGIAKAAEATVVTATSTVLGSVRYLSPEQASGREVGPASDLYSLGIVLYEMLTGEVPFTAETPIATAMRHLTEAPAHPSEFEPHTPAALEAVTLKLLEKHPADRYPSAGALAEDLKRLLAGATPAAYDPTGRIIRAGWPSKRPPRRKRRRRIFGALTIIPAVAGLVVLASGVSLGEESPFVRLVGERAQEPLTRVEAPATVAGGQEEERVALTAPESPPNQAGTPQDGGHEESATADEKTTEPEPQQLAVQPVAHKGTAPPPPELAPQTAQRQAPEIVAVPDLTGMSVAEAEVALVEVGLILRIASYARGEEVPEGVILYQDAPPGYEAYPGATVAVTVSSGPPPTPEKSEESKPVREKASSKEVPARDLEAKREPAREKATSGVSGRDRGKDDRLDAKEERGRAGQRPAVENRPHQEEEHRGSSRGANRRDKGDGGKDKRGNGLAHMFR
jgi:eukaryotic-like serine/threonine-protein kinase